MLVLLAGDRDRKHMSPKCSFCGKETRRGVAGPTPTVFICAECIALASRILSTADAHEGPDEH